MADISVPILGFLSFFRSRESETSAYIGLDFFQSNCAIQDDRDPGELSETEAGKKALSFQQKFFQQRVSNLEREYISG